MFGDKHEPPKPPPNEPLLILLIGVAIAVWIYARSSGRTFFQVTDFVVPMITPGLGFGRIGNFINGELWGKTTDLPWGVAIVFQDGHTSPTRHPSQLYQALLEGLALFVILWLFTRRPRPTWDGS